MPQLSVPIAEKLDVPLAELCNDHQLVDSARVPVLIRCTASECAPVVARVEAQGGKVRAVFRNLGAVAAWVPIRALAILAQEEAVFAMELEQHFTTA